MADRFDGIITRVFLRNAAFGSRRANWFGERPSSMPVNGVMSVMKRAREDCELVCGPLATPKDAICVGRYKRLRELRDIWIIGRVC
jgi:hypothetical protein